MRASDDEKDGEGNMTLLVIGASSDMGIALIDYVAEKYDSVIAHYHHMNDKLMGLKDTYGEKITFVQADLSSDEEISQFAGYISSLNLSPCHVVHFPAQQIMLRKFAKTEWEVFERGIHISVKSLAAVLKKLLPQMAREKYGRVVVMLSDAVVGAPPKYSADYVTAKYALLGLTKALAVEYADKGITINGVSPAFTETKFVAGMADYFREEHKNNSPIGRNLVPQDIVPTIAMLLSEEASCINGQNISINCGRG